jgi:hypothetical protein
METWVFPKYIILPCKNKQNNGADGYAQRLVHSSFATNGMDV